MGLALGPYRVRVVSKSRDYGLDFLCYDFSEELFIESNRCEEFGLKKIFFKNIPTVLNCVVLSKKRVLWAGNGGNSNLIDFGIHWGFLY